MLKSVITHNLLNIPGWHTRRHILVIESDDWGSIRMPSKKVYDEFIRHGVGVDRDPYCRYDGLATAEDLSALFDVLQTVKDFNGHPAVVTANAVTANPVFDKIKASNFKNYYYEPFTETLKRSSNHEGAWEMWQQGIQARLFYPQLHGREHLNVKKWLRTLQTGDETTRLAFDLGTFGLTSAVDAHIKKNYMGAFNSGLDEDLLEYNTIITEGQQLFERLFGYKSESFIATTYTWNPKIEPILARNGVRYLQGMVHQHIPQDDDTTFTWKKDNFTGRKSSAGLTYITRNCYFEPSQKAEGLDDCLNRIKIAFRWNKPAIICMHRLNVIGSLDESNRTKNLADLKTLLQTVVRRWPDVEFMSSDQLGKLIDNSYDK